MNPINAISLPDYIVNITDYYLDVKLIVILIICWINTQLFLTTILTQKYLGIQGITEKTFHFDRTCLNIPEHTWYDYSDINLSRYITLEPENIMNFKRQ